jgi:hypothetical protein
MKRVRPDECGVATSGKLDFFTFAQTLGAIEFAFFGKFG